MQRTKTTKLLIVLCLVLAINTASKAQVTIGMGSPPLDGVVLQLKQNDNKDENSNKGLILPRVDLEVEDKLYPMLKDNAEYNADPSTLDKSHIGLVVYNTTKNETFCPGLYVWDTKLWKPVFSQPIKKDITVKDADGNTYTAKWFSYGQCSFKGAYWITSNLYTTKDTNGNYLSEHGEPARINPAVTNQSSEAKHIIKVPEKKDLIYPTDYDQEIEYNMNKTIKVLHRFEYVQKFGLLYRPDQAKTVCPKGWQLPNKEDWENLANSYGANNTGKHLKIDDNTYSEIASGYTQSWDGYPTDVPENSGFNAYPAGSSSFDGTSESASGFGANTLFAVDSPTNTFASLSQDRNDLILLENGDASSQHTYVSVRCIKK